LKLLEPIVTQFFKHVAPVEGSSADRNDKGLQGNQLLEQGLNTAEYFRYRRQ
jgi:hypothetical protein